MKKRVSRNKDLHGNVPESAPVVLLIVDVLNDLNFPDNSALLKGASTLAKNIATLKKRCKGADIPTIYVNDNYGKWRSDLIAVLQHCLRPESAGLPLVERLLPAADDYVVLKPKHSIFYATPLDTLLSYFLVKTVILAGLTTSACILSSAAEIFIRDLKLFVPSDCVAGLHQRDHRQALELMRKSFHADTAPSRTLDLHALRRASA